MEDKIILKANKILNKLNCGFIDIDLNSQMDRDIPIMLLYLKFKDGYDARELTSKGISFKELNFIDNTIKYINILKNI